MKRKDFIKRSVLSGFSFALLGKAMAGTETCISTPGETEGPFPTHKPASLTTQNIIADRSGTPLLINIAINNINNKCAGLKDAMVDIWHCDSKGEYSEYGGKSERGNGGGPRGMKMQPPRGPGLNDSLMKINGQMPSMGMGRGSMQVADHVNEHFLRGRQTTNANGMVSFHSIYPGWYSGRAPNVHVHIYSAAGTSLLVTQIAFPEEISRLVYSQGVYTPHGQPDTTNAGDMVFNDSIANELGMLTGNVKDGFILSHSIYVKA